MRPLAGLLNLELATQHIGDSGTDGHTKLPAELLQECWLDGVVHHIFLPNDFASDRIQATVFINQPKALGLLARPKQT